MGPWTAAQKQDLGKAINDRLAQPGKKGTKRENQEVANFYGFLTKEDKAALQEDGPLHTRLSHAADIMASMLCFWPSEQTVGHIVSTVKALRASGLESPDDYHGAVQKLKSLVKSRLRKAPKDVDFIRRYTAPHELPESVPTSVRRGRRRRTSLECYRFEWTFERHQQDPVDPGEDSERCLHEHLTGFDAGPCRPEHDGLHEVLPGCPEQLQPGWIGGPTADAAWLQVAWWPPAAGCGRRCSTATR